jgi:hypothetical protein
MELELRFEGLAEDVIDAVADVQLVDLAMADVPGGLATTTSPTPPVSPDRPTASVTVELPVSGGAYEPGLVVHVRGRTPAGERIEFLNTRTTPGPGPADRPVRVVLTRIV